MKVYDPKLPLFFLHIPKSGGVSLRQVLMHWFGQNFMHCYAPHYRRDDPAVPGQPVLVSGHFNCRRAKGVEQLFPQSDQFITVLRDPWERALSIYFFNRRHATRTAGTARVAAMGIEEYMAGWPFEDPAFGSPLLCFLPPVGPDESPIEMIERRFVEVGVTDALAASIQRIAERLGRPFDPSAVQHLNISKRDRPEPDHLKPAFRKRNAQDYAIYEHFRARYD